MDSDRWQQIQETLADLLETPLEERQAVLLERCGEDAALRAEVESLLAAADASGGLLDDLAERAGLPTGAADLDASAGASSGAGPAEAARSTDSVVIGEKITHYRVDGVLGRGGMGEVYRATDVRLGRQVAMKVLPLALASNPDNVSRFEREARLLAALNHPNIAAIYDIEESGEKKVIILELVEGPTLADRIRETRGRGLPVPSALAIAKQIADAVEAAHDIGIVHRDLKPSNVKVAPQDRIKVLDFGIAKPEWAIEAVDAEGGPLARAGADQTQAGRVFGTAAYMSPEQARGDRVDRRTDIWAFGCVLYEMLTGRRAIQATEPHAARRVLLAPEIDWSRLPEDLPGPVRGLLQRCLCADPRQRLQAIGEARIVLDGALTGEEAESPPPPIRRRGVPSWAVAAAVVVAVVGAWLLAPGRTAQPRSAPRQQLQLVVHPAAGSPRLSPDGSRIVYSQDERLWIYSLEDFGVRAIEGLERIFNPAWSPDGRELAYSFDGRLWRLPVDGGRPTVVGELPPGPMYIDWGTPARIVVAAAAGLYGLPASGGVAEHLMPLEPGEGGLIDPHSTPDGAILFATGDRERIDAWIDGERITVLQGEGASFRRPHWVEGGWIVYVRAGTSPGIWAVRVDDALRPISQPIVAEPSAHLPTVSRAGHIAYVRRAEEHGQLVRVSRDGVVTPTASAEQVGLTNPALMPNGQEAIVVSTEGGWGGKLWLHSLDSGAPPRPVTVDTGVYDRYPIPSPSGHLVLYTSDRYGVRYLKLATLDRPDREITVDENVIRGTFSPDGRSVVYAKRDPVAGARMWIAPARGDGDPRLLFDDPEGGVENPRISPDGRWIAYVASRFNRVEVLVREFPEGAGPWQVTTGGGVEPRWSADGSELYYLAGNRLMAVPVRRDATMFEFGEAVELFDTAAPGLRPLAYQPLPGGDGFLMVRTTVSDLPYEQEAMILVQGWQE